MNANDRAHVLEFVAEYISQSVQDLIDTVQQLREERQRVVARAAAIRGELMELATTGFALMEVGDEGALRETSLRALELQDEMAQLNADLGGLNRQVADTNVEISRTRLNASALRAAARNTP